MRIRKGNKGDKKNYLSLQKQAFPFTDLDRESKFFSVKAKSGEFFVAEEGGEYAGHVCFRWNDYPFDKSIFIEELAVDKKFQGKGIGTALMESVIKYCRKKKITSVYLGTGDYKGNKTISFYEKQGFKKVGWEKDIEKSEYPYPELLYAIKVIDWKSK